MTNQKKLTILSLVLLILSALFIYIGLNSLTNEAGTTPITIVNTPGPALVEPNTLGEQAQKVKITKVIDGDTIETDNGQKIRLIGIDTPETVDPRRPVGCFGKEASAQTRSLVEGKNVLLVKDFSEADRFGRLLRYVYLPTEGDLLFLNEYLVRQGFAKAATFPPDVKYQDIFLQAEQEARTKKLGLWGGCA